MRHLTLTISLLLLIGGVIGLWRFRFERVENSLEMNLLDLKRVIPALPAGAEWVESNGEETLRLAVSASHPRVCLSVALPGVSQVEALHVRLRMSAKNLTVGKQIWDDGRVLLEWWSPDGLEKHEIDPISSLRGNASTGDVSLVLRPISGVAIPRLRIEHLGSKGEFEISKFEWNVVRERAIWNIGQWILGACWLVWIYALLSGLASPSRLRKSLAAAIWVILGIHFVIPGPWKSLRPIFVPFELGAETSPSKAHSEPMDVAQKVSGLMADEVPAAETYAITAALGKIPPQGNWLIQIKHQLSKLRLLLHGLLLFGPTMLFAFLVGQKRALLLAIGFAVAIEAAQVSFGYGFDYQDVVDLFSNGFGVAAGIMAYRMWPRFQKRFFARG
jgi:hypothetical protein